MAVVIQFLSFIILSAVLVFDSPETNVPIANIPKKVLIDTIIHLKIPERLNNATGGSEFAGHVSGLNIDDRDRAIIKEIMSGNVPSFSRKLRPVSIHKKVNLKDYKLIFFAACDYMAIGSDQDYLYIPMKPSTAQYLADQLDCSLPTRKMADIIYDKAKIKLVPQPIPPSDQMTEIPVLIKHTDSVKYQISNLGFDRSANFIIAGHKKDLIISNKIYSSDRDFDRVVIYGWHLSTNNPIQPVFNGHHEKYVDYSHGIRFISNTVLLNGNPVKISDILKDPVLSVILSDEGVISKPYYKLSD